MQDLHILERKLAAAEIDKPWMAAGWANHSGGIDEAILMAASGAASRMTAGFRNTPSQVPQSATQWQILVCRSVEQWVTDCCMASTMVCPMAQLHDHMVGTLLSPVSRLCACGIGGRKEAEHLSAVVDSMSCSYPWQPHQVSSEALALPALDPH